MVNATGDVENSLMALAHDEQEQQHLQNEVSALTNARDSSQQAYTVGSVPLRDLLNADCELMRTQDQLALNQANTAQDNVSVFRALGGGW